MLTSRLQDIIIIVEVFIICLLPLVNKKYIRLISGGILNKIVLLCIAFLAIFENYVIGLLTILGVITLITLDSRQVSKFRNKYEDDLEP